MILIKETVEVEEDRVPKDNRCSLFYYPQTKAIFPTHSVTEKFLLRECYSFPDKRSDLGSCLKPLYKIEDSLRNLGQSSIGGFSCGQALQKIYIFLWLILIIKKSHGQMC